ncbi:MAG: Na+/H+ antiporter subunit E [candidate division WOR-3 bacterium]|nr:Na+/H+ antiporter subunit E [candidate division WOR-3 bacterium]
MKKKITQFIVYFIIWLLLTWSLNYQEVIVGLGVALLAMILTKDLFPDELMKLLNPLRLLLAILYIPYLIFYIILANFDVAYRVLNPNLPINPGIVKVKTGLKNELARTILANSITLTPGTLTVEVDDDDYYIHWINITSEDPKRQKQIIIDRFEWMLRRIFE